MQVLVRVQARVRARRVRMALENQTAQQKLQLLEEEAHVKEIEDGWCDGVGSVQEIQTKLMKRKKAAAKRERAMAYALAHQLQAGLRQQEKPPGFEPDKNNWSWNWLERWMAVRPWENHFLDINLKDGVKIGDNEPTDAKNVPTSQFNSSVKKPISNMGNGKLGSRLSNISSMSYEKRPSQSDGSNSSPNKLVSTQEKMLSSSTSTKPVNQFLKSLLMKQNLDLMLVQDHTVILKSDLSLQIIMERKGCLCLEVGQVVWHHQPSKPVKSS